MNLTITIKTIIIIGFVLFTLACNTTNHENVKFEKQIITAITQSFSKLESNKKVKFVFVLKDESKCLSCYKLGFDMLNKYKDQTFIICEPTVYYYYENTKNENIKVLNSKETNLYKYSGSTYTSMLYFIKDKTIIDNEIVATDKFQEILNKMKKYSS